MSTSQFATAVGLLLAGVVSGGCTPVIPYAGEAADPQSRRCSTLYVELDRATGRAKVGDAQAARIASFPHLRVNRLLGSFSEQLDTREQKLEWIEALRALDYRARELEWRNLPTAARTDLTAKGVGLEALRRCGRILAQADFNSAHRFAALQVAAQVSDHYLDWQRTIGLYPIASKIGLNTIEALHNKLRQPFQGAQTAPRGTLIHYDSRSRDDALATTARVDAAPSSLGIPQLSTAKLQALLNRHAPLWGIDTLHDDDKPGRLAWRAGLPWVDVTHPTEYRMHSFTRYRGKVLLQLIYTIWFPARTTEHALDIYAGRLDGLMWRVTLDAQGEPLAYDSIHPCGCYYYLFARADKRIGELDPGLEPIFSPVAAPRLKPEQRILIKVAPGTHYIEAVTGVYPPLTNTKAHGKTLRRTQIHAPDKTGV